MPIRVIRNRFLLAVLLTVLAVPAAHAGLFGSNTVDDVFTVKSLADGQAVLEGDPKTLKAGDKLYFARSPYQFTVKEVKGNIVTIALPERQDLSIGNTLMRKINDQVKKGIDTENKLNKALED